MKRKIIFIGGIHGVGKTSLCNKLCKNLDIEFYSASDLIKKVKNVKFPTNKHNKEINENQDSLILAANKYINCETTCLLDGHFCLIDEKGNIIRVPTPTFTSLSPEAIIVLSDDPSNIYNRSQCRYSTAFDIDDIALFQNNEIMYSNLVSRTLGVPYLLANPLTEEETIIQFLKDLT
ncbi:MAG: ATP-binding protein [Bacillota bacterium]